jgi:hypothetical protein
MAGVHPGSQDPVRLGLDGVNLTRRRWHNDAPWVVSPEGVDRAVTVVSRGSAEVF